MSLMEPVSARELTTTEVRLLEDNPPVPVNNDGEQRVFVIMLITLIVLALPLDITGKSTRFSVEFADVIPPQTV